MKGKREMQCESRFRRLCVAFGRKQTTEARKVGSWRLDRQLATGWRILELCENGVEKNALGLTCASAAEMARALEWALQALELKRKESEKLEADDK